MDADVADAVIDRLKAFNFADELSIIDAEVRGLPDAPVLVVRFEDARRNPDGPQAAWWDFAACAEFLDDAEGVASFAHTFLEELFWAGAPYDERPLDSDGVTWGEMDSETQVNRLPPFLRM